MRTSQRDRDAKHWASVDDGNEKPPDNRDTAASRRPERLPSHSDPAASNRILV